MTNNDTRRRELIDALKRQAAKEGWVLESASEFHSPFDLRRPSGIASLDLATGGGLPAGGVSEISGKEGAGKNYLANQYIAAVQHNYGPDASVAVASFESAYDKDFGRKCGVQIAYDPYELDLIDQSRKRQGEKKLPKKAREAMQQQLGTFILLRGEPEMVLDQVVRLIDSNLFQIILIDSLDALATEDTREKALEDAPRTATTASLQTRFINKMYSALAGRSEDGRENETTIIALRQMRANLNRVGAYGKQWKVGGAQAVKHSALVQIQLRATTKIKTGNRSVGKVLDWSVEKGKAGCHDGPTGKFNYFYDPPRIDKLDDFIQALHTYGFLKKTARSRKIKVGGDVLFEASSDKELLEALNNEDRVLWNTLWSCLVEAVGLAHIRYS